MTPIEEIEKNIIDYGYLIVKPKNIFLSYYKLEDGTIIEALVRVESIIEDVKEPTGYVVRTSNSIKAYVPKEKRNPKEVATFQSSDLAGGVIDDDVQSEELSSQFSDYELNNGMILNIRTIVNQIKKTKFYSPNGEPIYSVIVTPIIKFKNKK